MIKFPWSTFAIAVLILLVSWQSMEHTRLFEAMWYSRVDVSEGELWRFFGGHLVHLGVSHLSLNLAAFLILAICIEWKKGSVYLLNLTIYLALLVSLGLYCVAPEIEYYAGISAVNYGLLTWLALKTRAVALRTGRDEVVLNTAGIVIALLVLHCAYQWWQNDTLFSAGYADTEIVVAWKAHLLAMVFVVILHYGHKFFSAKFQQYPEWRT